MARDIIHDAVYVALVKDGWTITDDPLIVAIEDSSPLEIVHDSGCPSRPSNISDSYDSGGSDSRSTFMFSPKSKSC